MTMAMLGAVLVASLIGSLHCVGMCGAFVAAVSGGQRDWGPLLAYQGARGVAYVGLGALAGLLGAGLDAGAAMVGMRVLAGPLMGLTLIALALANVWPQGGVERLRAPSREGWATPLVQLGAAPRRPSMLVRVRLWLTEAVRRRGARAGAAAGLLSALLPCGWLWAYVIVAASTGGAGQGAAVMAVFWLGSVPALLGVGVLAGAVARRFARHAPYVTAAIMLALGVLSLVGKLSVPIESASTRTQQATEPATSVPQEAPCH